MPRTIEHSAAVQRVLADARETAGLCGAVASSPLHLLHALFYDESRAHAILVAAGFTLKDLLNDFEFVLEGHSDGAPAPVDSRIVAAALRQCRKWLRDTPGETEIRTEHLLAALAVTDEDVGALFERLGLTPDGVRGAPAGDSAELLVIEEPPRERPEVGGQRSKDGGPEVGSRMLGATGSASAFSNPAATRVALAEPVAPVTDVVRILDAAANRGREGLRVVEDAARFLLNDAHLCGLLKSLRHELAAALEQLGSEMFHVKRDTPGDVGTAITLPTETARNSPRHVLSANCKRVEESLRTLEEYGKLVDPAAAATIEQLRYRFYTLEKALLTVQSGRERLADCRLYLLVTESACRGGIERVVKGALDGGVDAIQLREKGIDDRRLLALAERVRGWTVDAGALFIMNDRPDIAVLSGADGLHVGQDDLSVQQARRVVGPDQLVGVSTHSIEQARQAVLNGADYLGVGPTFASQTKQFESFAGLEFVRAVAAEIGLPWFAIGGIGAGNVAQVTEAGASRIAVSGAVLGADDPVAVSRELKERLQIANCKLQIAN